MLKIAPVSMPGKANGKTECLIVCHFVVPSEKLTSLKDRGTALKASLVVVIMTGKVIMPSVREPEMIDTPNLKKITKRLRPNSPYTTEETPARFIMARLIILVKKLSCAYSFKYMAASTPTGSENAIDP